MSIYRDITPKQQKVLRFIRSTITKQGRPPTIREIAGWFGFKSTGTVRDYLKVLTKKGYLKSTPKKSRSIEIRGTNAFKIPLLGNILAGPPNLAYEEIDEYIDIASFFASADKELFALRVQGDSMIEKHIQEGDIAIVQKQASADDGDVIAALLGDEATLKTLRHQNNTWHLEPANKDYEPIKREFTVLGKVVATIKQH